MEDVKALPSKESRRQSRRRIYALLYKENLRMGLSYGSRGFLSAGPTAPKHDDGDYTMTYCVKHHQKEQRNPVVVPDNNGDKDKEDNTTAFPKGLPIADMSYLADLQDLFPSCEIYYKVQSCCGMSSFLIVLTFGKEYPIASLSFCEDDKVDLPPLPPRTLFGMRLSGHKQLYLESLHVHPFFRRKGVGTRLMGFFFKIALERQRGVRYTWYLGLDGQESEASIFHAKVLGRLGLAFEGNSVAFPFEYLSKKISSLDLQPKPFSDEEKISFCSGDHVFDQVLDMGIHIHGLQLYDQPIE